MWLPPEAEGRLMEIRQYNSRIYRKYQMLVVTLSMSLEKGIANDDFVYSLNELARMEDKLFKKRYFSTDFHERAKSMLKRDKGR